jgi:hypothetical protein
MTTSAEQEWLRREMKALVETRMGDKEKAAFIATLETNYSDGAFMKNSIHRVSKELEDADKLDILTIVNLSYYFCLNALERFSLSQMTSLQKLDFFI